MLVPDFFWNRLLITWYIPVVGSVLFFIFFGFGQDAMTEYRRILNWVRVSILRQPLKASNESVLPTFRLETNPLASYICITDRLNSAPPRVARVNLDRFDGETTSIEDEKWGGESRHSARTDDIPLEPLSPHEREGMGDHRAKAGANV